MISDTLAAVMETGQVSRLKEYEHHRYREWHKVVLNDNGLPTLQKRGFKIPG